MAKTIHMGGYITATATTANTTQYWMYNCPYATTTTESNTNVKVFTAGTFSKLRVRLTANGIGVASTFTFRKNNTTDGNQVVTCTASTSGLYEVADGVTDTVTVNDLIDVKSVPGTSTGTMSVSLIACDFDTTTSTSDTVSAMITGNPSLNTGMTTASTTWYICPQGYLMYSVGVPDTVETNTQVLQRVTGTYKNLSINVTVNSRANTSYFRFRKNAGYGNQLIYLYATTTGVFTDSSGTDDVVATDKVCYSFTNGIGTEAISIAYFGSEFHTTTDPGVGHYSSGSAFSVLTTQAKATTAYMGIAGRNTTGTTESVAQVTADSAYTFSNLSINVISNVLTGAGSLTLDVNGVGSALTVPIAGTTTGFLEDTIHTVTVAAANLLSLKLVTGTKSGSGNMSFGSTGLYSSLAGVSTGVTCTVTAKVNTNKFIIKA